MIVDPSSVLSAYKKTGGVIDSADAGSGSDATSLAGGQSFGSFVKSFLGDGVAGLKAGENAAASSVTGKADLASIATAIDNAEVLLTEITTIRDKAISAYQTITSSAI